MSEHESSKDAVPPGVTDEVPPPIPPRGPGSAAPAPAPRRRRRWPMVLAFVLILLLLLVLLIPTIISSGPVRGLVLAKVNQNLNGHVSADDWSLGWNGNFHLDGLRVFDSSNAQILQVAHVTAHASIPAILRGKYDLGRVVVDGLDFVAVKETDGSLNFEHLAKNPSKQETASQSNAPSPSKSSSQPSNQKLPEVRADIVLQNCRGTMEDRAARQTAYLRSLDAELNVPDINSPITESIKAVLALGESAPGTFSVEGTTLLVKNNELLSTPRQILQDGTVEQKLTLSEVNLASIAALLGSGSGIQELSGVANGQLDVSLKPLQDSAMRGHFIVANLHARGPALKGDALDATSADVTISPTTIHVSPGSAETDAARITTGTPDGKNPIAITLVQGPQSTSRIAVFADVTPRSLTSLTKGQKPADPGRIQAIMDIDVGHLASAMPHLLAVAPGVTATSGRLNESATVTMTSEQCEFANHLRLAPVTLARTDHSAPATRPVLADYSLTFDAGGNIVAAGGNQKVTLSQLDLTDSQNLVSLKKTDDAIQVGIAPNGVIYPTGKLEFASDLKRVNELLRRLAPPGAAAAPRVSVQTDEGLEVHDGKLSGSIAFAPGASGHYLLSTQAQLADLTIARGLATPLQNEKLTLLVDAAVKDDSSSMEIGRTDVSGSLMTAHADNTVVRLKQEDAAQARPMPLLLMVQKMNLAIDIPSLPKLQTVLNAFSPPKAAQARASAPLPEQYAAAGPVPPSPTTAPAKPKADIELTSGGMLVKLVVSNDGKSVSMSPQVTASGLAFDAIAPDRRLSHQVGPIDLKTTLILTPKAEASSASTPAGHDGKAASPSLLEQIQSLQVSELVAHAVGTQVTLKQPLTLNNLSDLSRLLPATAPSNPPPSAAPVNSSLAAGFLVKGDIAPLTELLEALDAEKPGSVYPYTGHFAFDEEVALATDQQRVKGSGDITDFVVHEGQAVSFSEPSIHLGNDIQSAGQKLSINDLSVAMPLSKALELTIKGAVEDLQKQRQLDNITADLTYDLAKLWKIIYPMLSPANRESLKDVQMAGQFTRKFTALGSYPAGVPSNVALRSLQLRGGLMIGSFNGRGLMIQNLELPVFGNDGRFMVAYSDKPGDYPQPAACNGGQLSISGAVLDLSGDHPRLTMIPGTVALRNVSLNPTLADAMGKSLGNVLFAGASTATGQATLTINACDKLPLDNLVSEQTPANDGKLDMLMSINDVTIGSASLNNAMSQLSSALSVIPTIRFNANFLKSLRGSIKNYSIKVRNGVTTHDMLMTFTDQERPLELSGTMGLAKQDLNMTLAMPWKLLGVNQPAVASAMPNGIQIPVGGTISAPQFRVNEVVQKNLIQNGPQNILKNLPGLLGKEKNPPSEDNSGATSQPSSPADPLGALGNLFNKKKK